MFEKKNLVINCDVCNATKIQAEDYDKYENIVLNADILLADERSRSVLNGLPMVMNVDKVIDGEAGKEYHFQVINGNCELNERTAVRENTILVVNGSLTILPECAEKLESFKAIVVNGPVKCPQNMGTKLGMMTVNGPVKSYPDDCVILKEKFVMDQYFPLRAKENGKYYAEKIVIMADPDIDVLQLSEKNVRFVTEELLVRENLVNEAVRLVDETVKLTVIASDHAFVPESVALNERLLKKYGKKLFVYGNVTVGEESVPTLPQIEALKVKGKVRLHKKYCELFDEVNAEYGSMEIIKGRNIENMPKVSLDAAALEREPDGVQVRNVATISLADDISPEMIMERLEIANCASVTCSKEQESAVGMICKNVFNINGKHNGSDGEDSAHEGGSPMQDLMARLADLANTKVVVADEYIL